MTGYQNYGGYLLSNTTYSKDMNYGITLTVFPGGLLTQDSYGILKTNAFSLRCVNQICRL